MFADGAMPMVPVAAGPRSERMSPNRFEPTTTSNQSGCMTKCAHRMSMWNQSVLTCGYCAAISFTRSSQYGIEIEMPLDFVAEVTCFFGRFIASSYAYLRMRSTPRRENTACCDELALGARIHTSADRGILAFAVLAHDPEIDVSRV